MRSVRAHLERLGRRGRSLALPRRLVLVAFTAMLLTAACSASGDAAPGASGSAATGLERGFATGPAVLIPAGYEPPTDRVDSTGAYLPVNEQPTLVFLEAIW